MSVSLLWYMRHYNCIKMLVRCLHDVTCLWIVFRAMLAERRARVAAYAVKMAAEIKSKYMQELFPTL